MQKTDAGNARVTGGDGVADEIRDGAAADLFFGEGPAKDLGGGTARFVDHTRLPAAAHPQKLEAFEHTRQSRERFNIVVPDDTEDGDVGIEQPPDRRFEGAKGFEARVGAFYDVTGEEHSVDAGGDCVLDGGRKGTLGSEGAGVNSGVDEEFGEARGADAQVDIADGQQAEIASGGCFWNGGLGQVGSPFRWILLLTAADTKTGVPIGPAQLPYQATGHAPRLEHPLSSRSDGSRTEGHITRPPGVAFPVAMIV